MNIDGNTKKVGLIGHPVTHTFSPVMHNAAFEKLGLNYVYVAFDVSHDELPNALGGILGLGFTGVNVTVPHKEAVIPFMHGLAKEAILIGAVNTVHVIDNRRCIGHNTDAYGFGTAIEHAFSTGLKGRSVFIVGAGGGARAVAARCAIEESSNIVVGDVVNDKAERLVDDMKKYLPDTKIYSITLKKDSAKKYIRDAEIIVNATPMGMKKDDPLPFDTSFLKKGQMVFDLIYNPEKTKLMEEAEKKGCRVSNGLGMLLYQGMKSFEIWTGVEAPEGVMKRALIKRIKGGKK